MQGLGFKKGYIPWNKGKHNYLSKDSRYRIGNGWRGKSSSPFSGKQHTDKIKKSISKKVSILLKGNTRTKGKSWSENRRKAQLSRNGKPYRHKAISLRKPIKIGNNIYHPMWYELRKIVYKRDMWICQECGVHCRSKDKTKIQCHHIDYDISNNDLSNLITLCASCHAKTNFRRENWIIHYREKLKKGLNRITI